MENVNVLLGEDMSALVAERDFQKYYRRLGLTLAAVLALLAASAIGASRQRPSFPVFRTSPSATPQQDQAQSPLIEPSQAFQEQQTSNTTSDDGTATSSSSTSLTVNGQAVPLPENGTLHTTIPNGNGEITIDATLKHESSSSGGASVQSDSNITIDAHSNSRVQGPND